MGGDGGRKKKRGDDYSDDDNALGSGTKKSRKHKHSQVQGGAAAQEGFGVFIDLNNVIELGCTPQEKAMEKEKRSLKIGEIEKRIDRLMLEI